MYLNSYPAIRHPEVGESTWSEVVKLSYEVVSLGQRQLRREPLDTPP